LQIKQVDRRVVVTDSPEEIELRTIKSRQKARMEAGIPKNVTPEMIYQAQMDILENQARQENLLRELLARR
jgi:hypothetical protein